MSETPSSTTKESPHADTDLAAKCYPSGSKNLANARCNCGAIHIQAQTDQPQLTAFCHCKACRLAHAAPLYMVVYFDESEITIVKGKEMLHQKNNGEWSNLDKDDIPFKHRRYACMNCGTRVLNDVIWKDGSSRILGTFPNILDEAMSEMIQSWQPTMHVNCDEALLHVPSIQDGLPKYVGFEFENNGLLPGTF